MVRARETSTSGAIGGGAVVSVRDHRQNRKKWMLDRLD